ncbi:tRNA (adenine(58)-N(1))-methyltransferase catalytic subunit TRMT61A [Daktulosphaira vitifoliae]|uniref:tRNA (adenine(58)-N(1))-methyltransferase catalytic subunit TRMT61A n=1 Tax=Daktulosphaira vitifoliae TaxID=58002 RepID=UPI0021AA2E1A|nr:tRNA (adenine(58)-N(1))-methyltransferase catalytic subunit TRMT61A [Daktulosphaira vitifoliae]XP_050533010.1 tRNA (adenine(58)-N(1))-methyltransferase catalytic subunit TRMT61A [Daktulosphaira vitifoliae]
MSFNGYKDIIEEDDTVILYINPQNMYAVRAQSMIENRKGEIIENVMQTKYGALKISSLFGKRYGSKVNLSNGWAHVLHPTPELWTQTLPHRTQIIYTPDISLIMYLLELKPGSIVVESGTGSGSLTHSMALRVKPFGHVYTYDFHEQRAEQAQKEFKLHKIQDIVTCQCRDVCQNGFCDNVTGKADAVFLDLPHPHLVVPYAARALKPSGGRICTFSPCIEQVIRTCKVLQDSGFIHLKTIECLEKEYQVVNRTVVVPSLPSDQSAADDSNSTEKKFVACVPDPSTRGHTGYLTSATYVGVHYQQSQTLSQPLKDEEDQQTTTE